MPSWAGPVASILGGAASLATGNPFGALGIWSGANGLQGQTGSQHSASGGNPYGYAPPTGTPVAGYSQTDINGNPISTPTVSVDGGWDSGGWGSGYGDGAY